MREVTHNHYHHYPELKQIKALIESLLFNQVKFERKLMATVSDFVASVSAFFDRQDTAIADLQGDVSNLTDQIAALTAQLGQLSAEDQAALDAVAARAGAVADKLDALDALTPPVAPVATA